MYPSLASLRWSRRARRPYLVAPARHARPLGRRHALWKKRLVGWWFENAHLARRRLPARPDRGGGACDQGVRPGQSDLRRPEWRRPAEETGSSPRRVGGRRSRIERSFCSWGACIRRRAWRTCSRRGATSGRARAPRVAARDRRLGPGRLRAPARAHGRGAGNRRYRPLRRAPVRSTTRRRASAARMPSSCPRSARACRSPCSRPGPTACRC